MCMNSYVTYKEQLPPGCKSTSTSNYTIQIHDALCEKWRQEKERATGTSGTKNAGTKSKHLRKLPLKQQWCMCHHSSPITGVPRNFVWEGGFNKFS